MASRSLPQPNQCPFTTIRRKISSVHFFSIEVEKVRSYWASTVGVEVQPFGIISGSLMACQSKYQYRGLI